MGQPASTLLTEGNVSHSEASFSLYWFTTATSHSIVHFIFSGTGEATRRETKIYRISEAVE